MGTVFPNNYPNATAPGVNYNTPMVSFTTRERYTFASYANGSNYSLAMNITSRPKNMVTYATSFAAGAPGSTSTIDSNALTSMATAFQSSVCTGFEVIVTNTLASSNIQGIWYAFPFPNVALTTVTINNANQALAATGSFTDATPAFRYAWVRGDESDSDMVTIGTAASSAETAVWLCTSTSSNATYMVEIIHTWTAAVIASATNFLPVTNRMIDESAYERGMAVVNGQFLAPGRINTQPVVADTQHKSLLRSVCDAVTNYADEAKYLFDAVNNMAPAITGIYNTLTGNTDSDLVLYRHLTAVTEHAPRLLELLDEHKLGDEELRHALRRLHKYQLLDSLDRSEPFEIRLADRSNESVSSYTDLGPPSAAPVGSSRGLKQQK